MRTWFRRKARAERPRRQPPRTRQARSYQPRLRAETLSRSLPPAVVGRGVAEVRRSRRMRPRPPERRGAAREGRGRSRRRPRPRSRRPRTRRRTTTPKKSSLPKVAKQMLVSIDVGEQRVAVLEDGSPVEVYLEPTRPQVDRRQRLQGRRRQHPARDGGLVRRHRAREERLPVRRRDRRSRARRQAPRQADPGADQARGGGARPGRQGPDGDQGARLTTEISLPGRFLVYVPYGDGIGVSRRLDDDERERLKAICKGSSCTRGASSSAPLRRSLRGGAVRRPRLPAQALVDDQGTGGPREGAHTRLSRGRAPAARRPRSLPARLRAPGSRPRAHVPPHRVVPKRTSPELAGKVEWYRETDSLMESSGVEAEVRSTLDRRSTFLPAATSCSTTPRRSPSST